MQLVYGKIMCYYIQTYSPLHFEENLNSCRSTFQIDILILKNYFVCKNSPINRLIYQEQIKMWPLS